FAATAGAGGGAAAGVAVAVSPVEGVAGSSCLEQAPTATASNMHAASRDFGESVKVINIPPRDGTRRTVEAQRPRIAPYGPDCQPLVSRTQAPQPTEWARAPALFADAEAGEDVAEHLVGADLAGQG